VVSKDVLLDAVELKCVHAGWRCHLWEYYSNSSSSAVLHGAGHGGRGPLVAMSRDVATASAELCVAKGSSAPSPHVEAQASSVPNAPRLCCPGWGPADSPEFAAAQDAASTKDSCNFNT
jgi:hypothetical protein